MANDHGPPPRYILRMLREVDPTFALKAGEGAIGAISRVLYGSQLDIDALEIQLARRADDARRSRQAQRVKAR